MAVRKILVYPDPRLRRVAEPVTDFNDGVRTDINDMAETMYSAPGIGLASIQVGISKSMVVIDISKGGDDLCVLINPEIVESSGNQVVEEGCLSFPGYFARVNRAEWIRYCAFGVDGNRFEAEADGLMAVCVQHEVDHLTGKLFTDYFSRLRQQRVKKHFEKASKLKKSESLSHV